MTETRRAVIAYIITSDEHPSAEMIYKSLLVDYPTLSLATVYNNLRLLVEEGFVTELKRVNDPITYFDYMGHHHINLICESCGKIVDVDIPYPSIASEITEETGFLVTKEQYTVLGRCPQCQ
ncbi:Peroxide stress regulator PerR, FUR family [Streptococcus sp. DD13]|nr:Peroxide stress regulator PerR, FUR family [Streptococcus sp. DD13]